MNATLKDHMVRHMGNKFHKWKGCDEMCLTCKDVSTHKRKYEKKQQTYNDKINLVTWLQCFKECTHLLWSMHFQAVHTPDKIFECKKCFK